MKNFYKLLPIIIIVIMVACLMTYNIIYYNKTGKKIKNNSKKGVILMYCTQNIIEDWAKYSIDINKKYADKHNYDFVLVKEPYDSNVTHAWQKIPAMIELLEKNYDFVIYIDADAIVNKHEIKFEHFLNKYPGDIIACSDVGNSDGQYAVNGGMVIARNTNESKKLLKQWWDLRYDYPEFAFEQWALSDIVRNKHPNINGNIVSIAPETDFNSMYYEISNYINTKNKPDRFVLHFMSVQNTTRKEILSQLHSEII